MDPIWKDIAVFLDGTPQGEKIGRHAASLARRHKAHLVGVFGLSHSAFQPAESFARGHAALNTVFLRTRADDEAETAAAARAFAALADDFAISSEFRIIWRNEVDDGALRSLQSDLIVAAQPKPGGLPQNWSALGLLLATGTPVLLIPETWSGENIGDTVLIAWNRSREARRAANDAIPFLATAKRVVIVTVDSDRDHKRYGSEPGKHLVEHLARHGAHAEVADVSSEGKSISEAILNQALSQNADLLVIGAYSRSRTSEMLFGGVTRSLLASTQLPMLISR